MTPYAYTMPNFHFNPRLPRGRRRRTRREGAFYQRISIHASLAGGDGLTRGSSFSRAHFNPRLPRGRRLTSLPTRSLMCPFQSTPPSREATRARTDRSASSLYFNPRLPRGRRPRLTVDQALTLTFQSTPPSREATRALIALDEYYGPFQSTPPSREATRRARKLSISAAFQSTPPSREATNAYIALIAFDRISIHASLAGGDAGRSDASSWRTHFNPRLPRGRRHPLISSGANRAQFQSTPPSREATRFSSAIPSISSEFQSTPPSREATLIPDNCVIIATFQSTPPSREATFNRGAVRATQINFNPRLPRGRRRGCYYGFSANGTLFQSTPPSREATQRAAGGDGGL